MKTPKDTFLFRINSGMIEFVSKDGLVLGACPADSINFSKLSFFNSILCSCGTHMLTISNWDDDGDEMPMAFLSIWGPVNQWPLSIWDRIKNAFYSLRGRISSSDEIILEREHLIALKAIVDQAIARIDKALETPKTCEK